MLKRSPTRPIEARSGLGNYCSIMCSTLNEDKLEGELAGGDEAADSDEAFLEHAKLKAHEALKNVLLDGDAAVDSKPSLKHAKTWRTLCWMASKPMLGSRSCCSLKGTQYSR